MFELFYDSEELEYAKYNAYQTVDFHKSANQNKDNANDRNSSQQGDYPTNNSADNKENDKLDNEGNNVLFLNLKACGPEFFQKIHLNCLLIKDFLKYMERQRVV